MFIVNGAQGPYTTENKGPGFYGANTAAAVEAVKRGPNPQQLQQTAIQYSVPVPDKPGVINPADPVAYGQTELDVYDADRSGGLSRPEFFGSVGLPAQPTPEEENAFAPQYALAKSLYGILSRNGVQEVTANTIGSWLITQDDAPNQIRVGLEASVQHGLLPAEALSQFDAAWQDIAQRFGNDQLPSKADGIITPAERELSHWALGNPAANAVTVLVNDKIKELYGLESHSSALPPFDFNARSLGVQ